MADTPFCKSNCHFFSKVSQSGNKLFTSPDFVRIKNILNNKEMTVKDTAIRFDTALGISNILDIYICDN